MFPACLIEENNYKAESKNNLALLFHRDKALGPDGFNSAFFHDNWSIVKDDVIAGVLHFFETGTMPSGLNSTSITLVPKTPAPSTIRDCRPIACCNTIYKCTTKVLANRIQSVLPLVIGPSQPAFIKGRSIMEGIP